MQICILKELVLKHDFPTDFNQDSDEPSVTFVKIKASVRERAEARARQHRPQSGPGKKASYESSAAVQRWLKTQGYESEESPQKPAFNPAFLASRRDAPWLLSSLTPLYDQDLITDVLHEAHSGKEATVYCCAAHPSTGVEYLAAKIYRPRMFRSLRNDSVYRFSRLQRDEQGQAEHGNSRRGSAATRKTERGRAAQVASWIDYEYQTQRLLHAHGADVPRPYAQVGNAVLMEYIGAAGNPAPPPGRRAAGAGRSARAFRVHSAQRRVGPGARTHSRRSLGAQYSLLGREGNADRLRSGRRSFP